MSENLPAKKDETGISKRPPYEQWALAAHEAFVQMTGDEKIWLKESVFALQIIRGNEMLQKSNLESIKNAVANVAMTGITLNPAAQLAYLVPRDGKCCLDFSYRGLIKLAVDSKAAKSINAYVVYDWDTFEFQEGTDSFIRYIHNLNPPIELETAKNPDKFSALFWEHIVCAFSIAVLPDGSKDFIILPKWKLYKTYQSSKGKDIKNGPWKNHPDEQCRKTAVKYHSKTLQGYAQNDKLAQAVQLSNDIDGIDLENDKSEAGNKLKERFNLINAKDVTPDEETPQETPPQSPEAGQTESFTLNASPNVKLTGNRLKLWDSALQIAAGSEDEAVKTLKALSRGEISSLGDLESVSETLVLEILGKVCKK